MSIKRLISKGGDCLIKTQDFAKYYILRIRSEVCPIILAKAGNFVSCIWLYLMTAVSMTVLK